MSRKILITMLLFTMTATLPAWAQMCAPEPAWQCPPPPLEEDLCDDDYFGGCTKTECQAAIDRAVGRHIDAARAEDLDDAVAQIKAQGDHVAIAKACKMTCKAEFDALNSEIEKIRALKAARTHMCAPLEDDVRERFSNVAMPMGQCAAELKSIIHTFQVERCALVPPENPCCGEPLPLVPGTASRCALPTDGLTPIGKLLPALEQRERIFCPVAEEVAIEPEAEGKGKPPPYQTITLLDCTRDDKAEKNASCPADVQEMAARIDNGLCTVRGKTVPLEGRFSGRFDAQAVLRPMVATESNLCRFGVNAFGKCILQGPSSGREVESRAFPAATVYERLHSESDEIRAELAADGVAPVVPPLISVSVLAEFYSSSGALGVRLLHFPVASGEKPVETAYAPSSRSLLVSHSVCATDAPSRAEAQVVELRRIVLASWPDLLPDENTFPVAATSEPRSFASTSPSLKQTDCAIGAGDGALCWTLTIAKDPSINNLGGERLETWRPWSLLPAVEAEASKALVDAVLREQQKLPEAGFVVAYRSARANGGPEAALVTDGANFVVVSRNGGTSVPNSKDRDWLLQRGFHADEAAGIAAFQWWLDWYPLKGDDPFAVGRSCWRAKLSAGDDLYCGIFGRSMPGDRALVMPLTPAVSSLAEKVGQSTYARLFDLIARRTYPSGHVVSDFQVDPPVLVLKDASGTLSIVSDASIDTTFKVECSAEDDAYCEYGETFRAALFDAHRTGIPSLVVRSRDLGKPPNPVAIAQCRDGEEVLILGDPGTGGRPPEWRSLAGIRLLAKQRNPEKWAKRESESDLLECLTEFSGEPCATWTRYSDLGTLLTDSEQLREHRAVLSGNLTACGR